MSTTQRMQSPPCDLSLVSSPWRRMCDTHMHIVEALVDISQRPVVRDILVNLDLALHVIYTVV